MMGITGQIEDGEEGMLDGSTMLIFTLVGGS